MKLIKINTEKEEEEEIKNIKIRVNNLKESAEVQKKLFSLGIDWIGGEERIQFTAQPFLYIDNNKKITFGGNESGFMENVNKEMTIKELMEIEVKPKKKKKYVGITTRSSIYVIKCFSEEEFRKLEGMAKELKEARVFSVNLTDNQKKMLNKEKLLENKSLVWLSKERFK